MPDAQTEGKAKAAREAAGTHAGSRALTGLGARYMLVLNNKPNRYEESPMTKYHLISAFT